MAGFMTVQEGVQQFLHAFKAEICAAQHQQRDNQRGSQPRQQKCGRNQNQLVYQRTFGHPPDDGQFPVGRYAGYLVGVQGQIVADHADGFFRCHFGHQGDVVEYGCDVVEQGKQGCKSHIRVSVGRKGRIIVKSVKYRNGMPPFYGGKRQRPSEKHISDGL